MPDILAVCNAVFCIFRFCMVPTVNSINQLIFVMVKCGVLFEVRTEYLSVIYMSFSFKGLIVVLK
jgi:hypothetical protein